MLGKLFSNAASSLTPSRGSPSPSRPTSSLDSVQEDIYTRNLIFPDAEALYAHQHDQVFPMTSSTVSMLTATPGAFDTNPEIELEARDVRVVVMQEATSTFNSAALMYDSHPHVDAPACPVLNNGFAASGRGGRGAGGGGGANTTATARRTSIGAKPVVITQEAHRFGAFDRRPSAHSRQGSYVETEGQRTSREYREEIATIANCMFGASDVMAHKGTGSKVHILPTEPRGAQYPFEGGHGSLGRSSMRSGSRLAQSFTSESIGGQSGGNAGGRKRVLVTRIFPVPLLSDGEEETPGAFEGQGFPFPKAGEGGEREKERKPKQKRTPMYAIGLVIQLPATQNSPSTPRSAYRGVGSYAENESVSSSFNSLRPSWTVLGSGFGVESLDSSFISDVDDRIDMVTQHWDIIIRTLDHLQAVASSDIVALLKQVDVASPDPIVGRGPHHTRTASISVAGKRVEENVKPLKPIRTNVKTVQLMPYALAHNHKLRAEIEYARHRIVGGIKNLQVITRQGRWGIWRDEARWVRRWAGGKEQGFFFYNLLTAFLGTHTEWLEAIGPTWYRRRNYKQQRGGGRDEDMPIKARTVIVAADKMAARRLIFLLSAFLPNNQHHQVPFVRQHRPGTSLSGGAFSQSPPSYVPLNPREESLRRRVNRPKVKSTTTTNTAQQAPIVLGSQTTDTHKPTHQRRPSDTPSLPPGALPVPTTYNPARQPGLATTSTATNIPALPHFSTRRPVRGTGPAPRPGSSGSLAADDLIRSLKRGDTGEGGESASRWSGVLGSLWGGKRRGSTDVSVPPTQGAGTGEERGKGAEMMHAQRQEERRGGTDRDGPVREMTSTTAPQPVAPPQSSSSTTQTQPIHPSGAYESPVKTSITEDGVIDIDVPLPSLFASFPPPHYSALSSPCSSGILSSSDGMGMGAGGGELEGFENFTTEGGGNEGAMNVGGWVGRFHPDFVVQALPASTVEGSTSSGSSSSNPKSPTPAAPQQPSLEDQIRATMAAEPTPPLPVSATRNGEEERWITISTALIADTVAFTLKRIILRRLIRLPTSPPTSAGDSAGNSYDGRASIYGNPYPGVLGTTSPAEGASGGEVIKE
ncbi:hypothetical protein VE02_10124, partial [Pseudogymnoascus sp. 03VT05]